MATLLICLELFDAISAYDVKGITGILGCRLIDVNHRDQFNHTPLTYAAQKGHQLVCQLLLEHGADVNAKHDDDWTALHHATSEGHTSLCMVLLNYGTSVDAKDKCNWTPLHYASKLGYRDICELLLDHGADYKLKDNYGKTCKDKALQCGHYDIADLFDNCDNRALQTITYYDEVHVAAIGGDVFAHPQSRRPLKSDEEEISLMENNLKKMKLKIEIEKLNNKMNELEKKNQRKQDVERLIQTEEKSIVEIERKIEDLIKQKVNKTNLLKELKFERLIMQQDTSILEEVKIRKENLELQLKTESFTTIISDNSNIEIDCPICFNPMDPQTEIKQCKKGHYLCSYCFMKLKEKCPQCPEKKEHFERARAVEDVIAKVFSSQ